MTRALDRHLEATSAAMSSVGTQLETIDTWGRAIGSVLARGGRLLAVGNGGSAAEAQHLTAELVGRYCGERRALSAIALHSDSSALTAIGNDYGFELAFARQVEAHGREGDVLVALSTSGRSPNVVRAVQRARQLGLATLGLTGPRPNPLAGACDSCVAIQAPSTAAVQEAHLVAVHLLCEAVDEAVEEVDRNGIQTTGGAR